jgi:hypothetical protein
MGVAVGGPGVGVIDGVCVGVNVGKTPSARPAEPAALMTIPSTIRVAKMPSAPRKIVPKQPVLFFGT